MKQLYGLILFLSFFIIGANTIDAQNNRQRGGTGIFSPNSMFEEQGGVTYLGFTFGRSHQEISNLPGTLGLLFSPDSTYNFDAEYVPTYHLGITAMYGLQNTDAYLLFEGEYSKPFFKEDPFARAHGRYQDYEERNQQDVRDSLAYVIGFDYQKVHLRFGVGGFIKPWISVQAGFDWAINTTDRIEYHSNDVSINYPTRDLEIRDQLQDKLNGQNDFGAIFGLSFHLPFPIYLGSGTYDWMIFTNLNYRIGLSDVIRTQANNFRLQERQNHTTTWQLNMGFRKAL